MICRCFRQTFDLSPRGAAAFGRRARAVAELVAGMGDYDVYVTHMAARHPEEVALTRDEFFRARQAVRFGELRCC